MAEYIYIGGKQTSDLYWPQRDALKSFIIYWLGFPRYYVFYKYVQTPTFLIPACESVANVSFLFVVFLYCSFASYNKICKILSLES